MEIDLAMLKKLDLSGSADKVLNGSLDRIPPLIIDRCLRNAKSELIQTLCANFAGTGSRIAAETITMPRRTGHGPRPTTVATTEARVLYRALVTALDPALPSESRSSANWEHFRDFEDSHAKDYLVSIDIAACYEYVDHDRLRTELLTQSMNLGASLATTRLLGEIMGTQRGLPQMHWASDRLGDAYLDIIVRHLNRHGVEVARYVDDMKAGTDDWDSALGVVELAAEAARSLGLALSAEKTRILKRSTWQAQRHVENSVIARYFTEALDRRREEAEKSGDKTGIEDADVFDIWPPYGGDTSGEAGDSTEDEDEAPTGTEDVPDFFNLLKDSFWSMSLEWLRDENIDLVDPDIERQHRVIQQRLAVAVVQLGSYEKRLPDELLSQWSFRDPSAIRLIVNYTLGRASNPEYSSENPWSTLETITTKTRRSPWAAIWLLHGAGELAAIYSDDARAKRVERWAHRQLFDMHELVRAEAAWTVASFGGLSSSNLTKLYRQASQLTQPALAAAMIRQGIADNSLRIAFRDDGPLNRKAIEWAAGF